MNRPSPLVLLLLCGWLMSGCVSTGMARIVDPGSVQVSLSPGVHLSTQNHAMTAESTYLPQVELGARVGVTEQFDVGAKVYTIGYKQPDALGVQVETRFGLRRAPSLESGIDLTLAPALSYAGDGLPRAYLGVELPLLCGFNWKGTQLVLGPRVGYLADLKPNKPGEAHRFAVGTSLGFALPLASWARIVPEVTVRLPVHEPTDPMIHAGIGLLLGGYSARP